MSHIVTIKTQIRDESAIQAACRRLSLPAPQHGKHRVYGTDAEGIAVQLPDWRYPVVCQLQSGELKYDDFGGYWGNPMYLDQFLQAYAIEKSKIEARKMGRTATETKLADGSIKLTIRVGGQS